MMKDVTILTFEEVERIKADIDNMIDNAKDGAYEAYIDAKTVCSWLIKYLEEFRKQFE